MNSPQILVESVYGSTSDYAQELAARTGGTIQPLTITPRIDAAPLIVCAPNYGPVNKGVTWLKENPAIVREHACALVVVGMSLADYARTRDAAGEALGELASEVDRFYLRGRLNHSKLTAKHRSVLWSVNQLVKRKPALNDNDRNMLAEYGQDIDDVDFAYLQPVLDWWHALAA